MATVDRRELRRLRLQDRRDPYLDELQEDEGQRERDTQGRIFIKGSEAEFELTRQGRLAFYLGEKAWEDPNAALSGRSFFRHDIRTQSGKHTHQGGLVIFVVEGKGHSTVNGNTVPWKKHDAILLPMLPELCEHQHFNDDPGNPAVWCAFIYEGMSREYGNNVAQNSDSPEFKGSPTV